MVSARKTLLLVFSVFFVLIGGGLFWLHQTGLKNTGKEDLPVPSFAKSFPDSLTPAEKSEDGYADNILNFKKALAEDDESQCHQITAEDLRSECFDRVRLAEALRVEDLDLCSSITDAQMVQYCQDTVVQKKSLSEKNPQLCLQIKNTTQQEDCTRNADQEALLAAGSAEDCTGMKTQEIQQTCQDKFRLLNLKSADTIESCESFNTADGKVKCQEYFWHVQAVQKKDPTLCLKISAKKEREQCEESMKVLLKTEKQAAGILQGKSEYCADFSDSELRANCQDEANYYAAKIYKKTDYCQKIKDGTLQTQCAQELTAINDDYWLKRAQTEKNEKYCASLSSPAKQEFCRANS